MAHSITLNGNVLCTGEPGLLDGLYRALVNPVATDAKRTALMTSLDLRYRTAADQETRVAPAATVQLLDGERVLQEGAVAAHESLLDFECAVGESHGMSVPEGWLVFTSTRPLLGHQVMENAEFFRGRFRAAIDPDDAMATRYIAENRKLAACIAITATREEMLAMALFDNDYQDRYLEEFPGEELWEVLRHKVQDLSKLRYGAAQWLLQAVREDQQLLARVTATLAGQATPGAAEDEPRLEEQPDPAPGPSTASAPTEDAEPVQSESAVDYAPEPAPVAEWEATPYADRIRAIRDSLQGAGRLAEEMWSAIQAGIRSDILRNRLTEEGITFREGKARQALADSAPVRPKAEPTLYSVQSLCKEDVAFAQLPDALLEAAAGKLNAFGEQLAELGFAHYYEVTGASPEDARTVAGKMREVARSLLLLAPARYRIAKGYRKSDPAKLERFETLATTLLGIDTRAHPGIAMDRVLTASGERGTSLRRRPRPAPVVAPEDIPDSADFQLSLQGSEPDEADAETPAGNEAVVPQPGAAAEDQPNPHGPNAIRSDLSEVHIFQLRQAATAGAHAGWLMLDDSVEDNGSVRLISQHQPRVATFRYDPRSGTDHMRARTRAIAWAQDNPELAPQSTAELVVTPMSGGTPQTILPADSPTVGRYQGPQDVSSVAGQKELANRGATIAALLAMNGQLRTLAPDDAWSDRVIEQAEDLDAVRDSISASLVRAQRGAPEVSVEDEKLAALRARLEEASGAELKDVFDLLQLAGTRLTHTERVELLVREDAGEVTAALDRVQGLVDQSLEDEVAQPETMQALLAAVEQGRKAHYDYDGDYGVTLWIEETPHGWVMKSREDGSSATATKGGAGPNRWGKDVALAAVERSAKERFSGADVVSTATAGQAEPAHYSDKVLSALVAAHGWAPASEGFVSKALPGGDTGGELNQDGVRLVTASFDQIGRYLTLRVGFTDAFDMDCRDVEPLAAAAQFDLRTQAWAQPAPAETFDAASFLADLAQGHGVTDYATLSLETFLSELAAAIPASYAPVDRTRLIGQMTAHRQMAAQRLADIADAKGGPLEPDAPDSDSPAAIDSLEGEMIGTGPFASLRAQRQSALGIDSDAFNIRASNDRVIGYVAGPDFEAFVAGDASRFTPVANWQSFYSTELAQRMGLQVKVVNTAPAEVSQVVRFVPNAPGDVDSALGVVVSTYHLSSTGDWRMEIRRLDETARTVACFVPRDGSLQLLGEMDNAGDIEWLPGMNPNETSDRNPRFDRLIQIAADSVEQLRNLDVYRVLSQAQNPQSLDALGAYIERHRPDLASEIAESLVDIRDEYGWPVNVARTQPDLAPPANSAAPAEGHDENQDEADDAITDRLVLWPAYEAARKDGTSAEGFEFRKVGGGSRVYYRGEEVGLLEGRKGRQALLDTLKSAMAQTAKAIVQTAGEHLTNTLVLPESSYLTFDAESEARFVSSVGNTTASLHIHSSAAPEGGLTGEIRFTLSAGTPRAVLWLTDQATRQKLMTDTGNGGRTVSADTFGQLLNEISEQLNPVMHQYSLRQGGQAPTQPQVAEAATPPVVEAVESAAPAGADDAAPAKRMPYITDEQADHLFGVDRKRAKALERIAAGNAWFASEEKAQAFVEANAIGDTHVAVQIRDNRWDIVAAPVADQAATVELATIAPVAKPAWVDQLFVYTHKEEYGPTRACEEAVQAAKDAPAGTVIIERGIRPVSGKEWHVAYIAMGDGTLEQESLGATLPLEPGDLVANAFAARDRKIEHAKAVDQASQRQSEAQRQIAAQHGFKVGMKLGSITPNTGKMLRGAYIHADHGDGSFDIRGVAGSRDAEIRHMTAQGLVQAIERAEAERKPVMPKPVAQPSGPDLLTQAEDQSEPAYQDYGDEAGEAPAGAARQRAGDEPRNDSVVLVEPSQMAAFTTRLDKLNAKAERFGLAPIKIVSTKDVVYERRYEYVGSDQDKQLSYLVPARKGQPNPNPVLLKRIEIEYPEVKLGNWRVIGKLEAVQGGKLAFAVSQEAADVAKLTAAIDEPLCCEHCNTKRNRKDGFLLRDNENGDYKQVGSTCLEDFTGINPAAALFLAQMSSVVRLAEEDFEAFSGSGRINAVETREFLADVSFLASASGFVSAGKARETGWMPTYQAVGALNLSLQQDPKLQKRYWDQREEHRAKADAIREWAAARPAATTFDHNVKLLLASDAIETDSKHLAFAAAAYPMYSRETSPKQAAAAAKKSSHVGAKGDKTTAVLTVDRVIPIETQYGFSDIVLMRDEHGNIFKWKASNCPEEIRQGGEGKTMEAAFTIKGHDDYNGIAQTAVTRLSVKNWLSDRPVDAPTDDEAIADELVEVSAPATTVDAHSHEKSVLRQLQEAGTPVTNEESGQSVADLQAAIDNVMAETQAAPLTLAPAPTVADTQEQLAQGLREQWRAQVGETFTIRQEYPAVLLVRGQERRFAMWKDSGDGPLKFKLVRQASEGPVLEFFKVGKDNAVEHAGTKALWALTDEARDIHLQEFAAVFEAPAVRSAEEQGYVPEDEDQAQPSRALRLG